MRRARRLACGALALAVLAAPARAQEAPGPDQAPEATADASATPPGESTPRTALRGYIEACRDGDFERAATHLDLSQLAPGARARQGPLLARRLKVVLDQTLWITWENVSNDPAGRRDDGLPPDRDSIGTIETKRGAVDVTLQRVRDDGARVWKISSATVAAVPALYEEHGYGALGDRLPSVLFEVQFLDAELWQWVGLMSIIGVAYLASLIAAALVLRLLRPLAARSRTGIDDELLRTIAGPIRLLLAIVVFFVGTLPLGLSLGARDRLGDFEQALVIVGLTWLLVRVIDVFGARAEQILLEQGKNAAKGLVPIGRRVVKVILFALAFLAVLQNLGFEVTGLIAGLGVGGLAVALAAQKTLENMFGALTLATDQPVGVGDFCRFGDKIGTIEEIGLRSTRVRTLARTIVTVPNAEFASLQLENFTKRDRMWLSFMMGVRYETTPDQMRFLLAELRRMLLAHPRVSPDPARVRFSSFGAYSLDLEFFAYVLTQDWNEFLGIREDIFLRVMDVVERSGTSFAFPSQTIYAAKDGGLDAEQSDAAAAQVRAWREQSELPFPDFSEEQKSDVAGKLAYPPEGSSTRRPG